VNKTEYTDFIDRFITFKMSHSFTVQS